MIKAVIFDCFGVLTTDNWKEFRATLPDQQNRQLQDLTRQYDIGALPETDLIQETQAITGRSYREVRSAIEPQTNKNFPLVEYIRDLKARGYKIGFLSNINDDWPTREFLTPEEISLFDAVVMSYEVGYTKPDPRIYEVVKDRLGVEFEECIFVDDVERNCTAAEELGMKTVWYQNYRETKDRLEQLIS